MNKRRHYAVPTISEDKTFDWDESIILSDDILYLKDSRPVRVQVWTEDGYTFITYLLTDKELEGFDEERLLYYLMTQGIDFNYKDHIGRTGIQNFTDSKGIGCVGVTILVGGSENKE